MEFLSKPGKPADLSRMGEQIRNPVIPQNLFRIAFLTAIISNPSHTAKIPLKRKIFVNRRSVFVGNR